MPNLNNDGKRVEVNGFIVRNSDGSKVTEEQIRAVRDALDYANKSPTATNVRNEAQQKIKAIVLTNEKNDYYIPKNFNYSGYNNNCNCNKFSAEDLNTVWWNPNLRIKVYNPRTNEIGYQSPALNLFHEFSHAIDPTIEKEPESYAQSSNPYLRDMKDSHEKFATEMEQRIAKELNEPSRYTYNGIIGLDTQARSVLDHSKSTTDIKNGTLHEISYYKRENENLDSIHTEDNVIRNLSTTNKIMETSHQVIFDKDLMNIKFENFKETNYQKGITIDRHIIYDTNNGNSCKFEEKITELGKNNFDYDKNNISNEKIELESLKTNNEAMSTKVELMSLPDNAPTIAVSKIGILQKLESNNLNQKNDAEPDNNLAPSKDMDFS